MFRSVSRSASSSVPVRWAAVLLFSIASAMLGGCASPTTDGTGTSEGASTAPAAADAHAQAILAGSYGGHMVGEWDGSLTITSVAPEKLDFEFEISPDLDVAPEGRLGGTATLAEGGHYRYVEGSCTLDFSRVTDGTGAPRGDLFINASLACGVMLGIDDASGRSTAFDLTATWRRM